MSDSLRSLTKKERLRANRSGRSPKMSESLVFFAHFFAKTSDSLRKPMSEFPALILTIALTAQSSRKETVLFLLFTWIRIRSEEDDLHNADQDPKPCILFNSIYRYQQKTTLNTFHIFYNSTYPSPFKIIVRSEFTFVQPVADSGGGNEYLGIKGTVSREFF